MDYEKKYKEALELMKDCIPDEDGLVHIEPSDIFPELAESEDERIRKALLNEFIHLQSKGYKFAGLEGEEIITWLEKQCQDGKVWFYRDDYVRDKKQAYQDGIDNVLNNPQKYGLEKQGEQKPVDKVESKFKVGDWVMLDRPVLITKIKDMPYNTHQYWTSDGTWFGDATKAKLWTIQDAKDGDVLYLQKDGKEHIIIYKGVIKERFRAFVSAYCAYNGIVDAFCFADVSRYVDIAYGGIVPATKEQSDLLFQKMHEAGYEWDAEKKELKKIEQKPAWSEEDEEVINLACSILYSNFNENENFDKNQMCIGEIIEKLKSLKDRVQPQPKQEWSEEDEVKINRIVACLENLNVADNDILLKDVDWLKSFRPQNTWKPSEEQLACLKIFVEHSPDYVYCEALESLLQDLKKLREE